MQIVLVAIFLLIELYQEIGCGLESLVYCTRVFAVVCHFLESLYETMEQGECLVVYVANGYFVLLCHNVDVKVKIQTANICRICNFIVV